VSVFVDLLKRARDAGATGVSFDVNLITFLSQPETDSWTAFALLGAEMLNQRGRSGEEALRNLVDRLEASR
jgi:hypothetical protein